MTPDASSTVPYKRLLVLVIVLLAAAIMGLQLIRGRSEALVKNRADQIIADVSALAAIDYEQLSVGIFGRSIHITNINIAPAAVNASLHIGELIIDRYAGGDGIPRNLTLSARAVTYPEFSNYLETYLPEGGIPNIGPVTADLFLDYNYDPDIRTLTIRRFMFNARDLGTVSLASQIGNIDLEKAALYLIIPHTLIFNGFTTVYSDHSLLSRWTAAMASRRDMTPGEFSEVLQANLRRDALRARNGGDRTIAEALDALAAFQKRPDHLNLEARPKNPLPFGRLTQVKSFEEFIDLLKVRILANEY